MRGNKFDKQLAEFYKNYKTLKERKRKAEKNMDNKNNIAKTEGAVYNKLMQMADSIHEDPKLCPPWIEYYNKLECMFGCDPDITIQRDSDRQKIIMLVDNNAKATALRKLLPYELTFGNVEWTLDIVPGNSDQSKKSLLLAALKGNPNFRQVIAPAGDGSRPFTFFLFKRRVAQYYNDDINDVYGYRSLLYSDLAREIFGDSATLDGIRFCTDVFDDECCGDEE